MVSGARQCLVGDKADYLIYLRKLSAPANFRFRFDLQGLI